MKLRESQRAAVDGPVVPENEVMPAVSLAPTGQYQPNALLTVADVCNQYGVGRTTLYAALAEGKLPAKVLGKRGTRIRREDIDNWVNSLKPYRPQGSVGSATKP